MMQLISFKGYNKHVSRKGASVRSTHVARNGDAVSSRQKAYTSCSKPLLYFDDCIHARNPFSFHGHCRKELTDRRTVSRNSARRKMTDWFSYQVNHWIETL
jgi:hypothetical protein